METDDPNHHVRDFLVDYFKSDVAPKFAVMISGPWGTGKTHFVKTFAATLRQGPTAHAPIYISLYGMSAVSDIDKAIAVSAMQTKSRAVNRLLRGVGSRIRSASLGADIAAHALATMTIAKYRNVIIDDIERCAIPVDMVLGYVNHRVEHDGCRFVLVCNEDKLASPASAFSYNECREKVVGQTFHLTTPSDAAVEAFISELGPAPEAQAVRRHTKTILSIYAASAYNNLRSLRQSILSLHRVISRLHDIDIEDDLLDDFVAGYISRSIEMLAHRITCDDMAHFGIGHSAPVLYLSGFANNALGTIARKYHHLHRTDQTLQPSTWVALLYHGSIPSDLIRSDLSRFTASRHQEAPLWQDLWEGENLEDAQFAEKHSLCQQLLDNGSIHDIGTLLHIVGVLCHYDRLGIPATSVDIRSAALRHLRSIVMQDVDGCRSWARGARPYEASHGFAFLGKDEPAWRAIASEIPGVITEALRGRAAQEADSALAEMSDNLGAFHARLSLRVEPIEHDFPYLHHINPATFVSQYLKLDMRGRFAAEDSLRSRFNLPGCSSRKQSELAWLERIRSHCLEIEKERQGRITSVALINFRRRCLDALLNVMQSLNSELSDEL
jgi:hypothetical protein